MAVKEKEKEASVVPGKAAQGARPSLGKATGSFVLVLATLISLQDRFDQSSVCLCPQTERSSRAIKCFIKL